MFSIHNLIHTILNHSLDVVKVDDHSPQLSECVGCLSYSLHLLRNTQPCSLFRIIG